MKKNFVTMSSDDAAKDDGFARVMAENRRMALVVRDRAILRSLREGDAFAFRYEDFSHDIIGVVVREWRPGFDVEFIEAGRSTAEHLLYESVEHGSVRRLFPVVRDWRPAGGAR